MDTATKIQLQDVNNHHGHRVLHKVTYWKPLIRLMLTHIRKIRSENGNAILANTCKIVDTKEQQKTLLRLIPVAPTQT